MRHTSQRKVLSNVARRGYMDGWTLEQFLLRQAVKMLEEACELFLSFKWRSSSIQIQRLRELVTVTKEQARNVFDDKAQWNGQPVEDSELKSALGEMGDCTVVLCCMVEAANDITGQYHNLIETAVKKSQADIKRGIR